MQSVTMKFLANMLRPMFPNLAAKLEKVTYDELISLTLKLVVTFLIFVGITYMFLLSSEVIENRPSNWLSDQFPQLNRMFIYMLPKQSWLGTWKMWIFLFLSFNIIFAMYMNTIAPKINSMVAKLKRLE